MRIVATCLLPATLLGCASIEAPTAQTAPETTVMVDSRIESMSVIQLLSGYFLVSYLDSSYKREATEYFAGCRDHPAVAKQNMNAKLGGSVLEGLEILTRVQLLEKLLLLGVVERRKSDHQRFRSQEVSHQAVVSGRIPFA
jgi:hypothetical protein